MRPVILAATIALSFGTSQAQVAEFRATPNDPPSRSIPLNASVPPTIDVSGNVRIVCAQTGCGLPVGGGGSPPVIGGFGLPSSVAVGQVFFPTWSSTGADFCMPFLSSPVSQLQGWGSQVLATSGSGSTPAGGLQFNSAPAVNPATLGIRCYGAGGRTERTAQVSVTTGSPPPPPPPPPAGCARNGAGLLIQPNGWTNSGMTWTTVAGSPFPGSGGSQAIAFGRKDYIALPFVARANENMELRVVPAGNVAPEYQGLYYTISECPGDFRAAQPATPSDEPTLAPACRGTFSGEQTRRIFTSTGAGNTCQVILGRTYYLNLIQGDPSSILNGSSLCGSAACGVRFQFQG